MRGQLCEAASLRRSLHRAVHRLAAVETKDPLNVGYADPVQQHRITYLSVADCKRGPDHLACRVLGFDQQQLSAAQALDFIRVRGSSGACVHTVNCSFDPRRA